MPKPSSASEPFRIAQHLLEQSHPSQSSYEKMQLIFFLSNSICPRCPSKAGLCPSQLFARGCQSHNEVITERTSKKASIGLSDGSSTRKNSQLNLTNQFLSVFYRKRDVLIENELGKNCIKLSNTVSSISSLTVEDAVQYSFGQEKGSVLQVMNS